MKIVVSFFSVFVGWLVGLTILVLFQVQGDWENNTGNLPFYFFSTSLFTFLGWALFAVPAILKFKENSVYFRLPYSIAFASLLALVAYFILTFLYLNFFAYVLWISFFACIPVIIGAIAGLLYPLLNNLLKSNLALKFRPIPGVLIFLIPISCITLPILAFPSFEQKYPELAYHYGTPEMRNQIGIMFMKQVKVGDRFEDLHRKMPFLFKEPVSSQTGGFSGFDYDLEMKDGVVTKFEIKNDAS